MIELDQNCLNVEEALQQIGNGIVVVYQRGSGSFLMLNNLLNSYLDDRKLMQKSALRIFSINELNPLYKAFSNTCGIPNNSAVIIVINSQIREIMYAPISKYKLLHSIQLLA